MVSVLGSSPSRTTQVDYESKRTYNRDMETKPNPNPVPKILNEDKSTKFRYVGKKSIYTFEYWEDDLEVGSHVLLRLLGYEKVRDGVVIEVTTVDGLPVVKVETQEALNFSSQNPT